MNIGMHWTRSWTDRGVTTGLLLAVAVVLAACQQPNVPAADAAPPPPDVAALAASASAVAARPAVTATSSAAGVAVGDVAVARDAVIAAIGAASCQTDTQCRTVGLGSRPCGGPEEWVAWSTTADSARIDAAAARHRELRKAEVDARGMMGICAVLPDPGAVCRAGRCEVLVRP